jgi:hypothetical protein
LFGLYYCQESMLIGLIYSPIACGVAATQALVNFNGKGVFKVNLGFDLDLATFNVFS